jgi:hypothetical protein
VHAGGGVALIVAGVGLGLVVVFALWEPLSAAAAFTALAGLGMMVGAGALLVQDDPGLADWALTLGALAVLTPLHGRLVFGTPGRSA